MGTNREKNVNLNKSVRVRFYGNEVTLFENNTPIGQWGVTNIVHMSKKEFLKMCSIGMKYCGKVVKNDK